MSAPRVPPGSTQQEADWVYGTWISAFVGESEPAWFGPGDPPFKPTLGEWRDQWSIDGVHSMVLAWETDAAKLRAWAAVGAPVLTPESQRVLEAARAMTFALREDGEPVDPWMGLAHLVEALRAESDAEASWSESPREAIIAWNRRTPDRLATIRADLLPPRIEDATRTIREEVDRFAHVFGEDGQFVVRTRAALASLADCAVTARRGE